MSLTVTMVNILSAKQEWDNRHDAADGVVYKILTATTDHLTATDGCLCKNLSDICQL